MLVSDLCERSIPLHYWCHLLSIFFVAQASLVQLESVSLVSVTLQPNPANFNQFFAFYGGLNNSMVLIEQKLQCPICSYNN